ncbi:MAG: hypothetical protein KKD31_15945 [Bacteroidetes bacterium]|nr:hypothetical protein [Bacteroidota bacterium]
MLFNRLSKVFVFLLLLAIIVPACKKRSENRILGTWERINIRDPYSKTIEFWDFQNSTTLIVSFFNSTSGDTTSSRNLNYNLPRAKKMNYWYPSDPDQVSIFEIKDLKKSMMRFQQMDGAVVLETYEFIKYQGGPI